MTCTVLNPYIPLQRELPKAEAQDRKLVWIVT